MWTRLNPRHRRGLFILASVVILYSVFLRRRLPANLPQAVHSSFGDLFTSSAHEPAPGFQSRIVAVGDLHGDLPHAVQVLRMAGLIDTRNRWIGRRAVLVQTGDIVDRGKDTILLYQLMGRLQAEAHAAGGAVVSLLGNHEYMNALGDWRYVTKEDIQSFGGSDQRRKTMSSQGWIGKAWLANYSVAARVPSIEGLHGQQRAPDVSNFVKDPPADNVNSGEFESDSGTSFSHSASAFVHGGITPHYARLGLTEINRIGHSLLHKALSTSKAFSHLPHDVTPEEAAFYSEKGPLWERSYALEEDEGVICKVISEAAKILKVKRLIMGHTIQFQGITSRCNGQIVLIDTGISSAYGGPLSALEIAYTLHPSTPSLPTSSLPLKSKKKMREVETLTVLQESQPKKIIYRHERMILLK